MFPFSCEHIYSANAIESPPPTYNEINCEQADIFAVFTKFVHMDDIKNCDSLRKWNVPRLL